MAATTMVDAHDVKLIADAQALRALAEEWRALDRCAGGPIEHFEWSSACVEGLKNIGPLRTYAVWSGNRCVAIAPLVLRTGLLPRLESLGADELREPMDFLYGDRDGLARLCFELTAQRLPIHLPRVPAESPVIEELSRAFNGKALIYVGPANAYRTLRLDQSWTTPESHFNSGRRSDFRRALRHANSIGPTEFQVLTPSEADVGPLLADAYDAELNSWKGRKGTALALDPLRAEFYRHYLHVCCEKGLLRIAFMRIGGKAVAMQIAVESNNRLWLNKIGHNEDYSKCSPGTLLMLNVVRYAAERGLDSIEFLGADEPWTRLWSPHVRECKRVLVCPVGIAGLALFAVDWARRTAVRHLKRWGLLRG